MLLALAVLASCAAPVCSPAQKSAAQAPPTRPEVEPEATRRTASTGTSPTSNGSGRRSLAARPEPLPEQEVRTPRAEDCVVIKPDAHSFGDASKGCWPPKTATFLVYNTCSVPLTLRGLGLVAPSGARSCASSTVCDGFRLQAEPRTENGTEISPEYGPAIVVVQLDTYAIGEPRASLEVTFELGSQLSRHYAELTGTVVARELVRDVFVKEPSIDGEMPVLVDASPSMAARHEGPWRTFFMRNQPYLGLVSVKVVSPGQPARILPPNAWRHDPGRNAITLVDPSELAWGDALHVSYHPRHCELR